MPVPLATRAGAELLGTAVLVATVVGSGVMATTLTADVGVQLLLNAGATVAALGVLVWCLGPVSGAHLNPAVTVVAAARRELAAAEAGWYVVAQLTGGLAGAALANLMFELPAWHASSRERAGAGLWLGEVVATAGLLFVIGAASRRRQGQLAALLVPAWIGAAYVFTSSTSFANPAVTVARSGSDTFAGIAPTSVPLFVAAQLVGAGVGAFLARVLVPTLAAAVPPAPLTATEGPRPR